MAFWFYFYSVIKVEAYIKVLSEVYCYHWFISALKITSFSQEIEKMIKVG